MKNKKGQDEAIKGEELYEFNPNVLPEGQSSGDAKYDELLAQYIRLQADFDNFRKRNSSTASVMYASGINDILVDEDPEMNHTPMVT